MITHKGRFSRASQGWRGKNLLRMTQEWNYTFVVFSTKKNHQFWPDAFAVIENQSGNTVENSLSAARPWRFLNLEVLVPRTISARSRLAMFLCQNTCLGWWNLPFFFSEPYLIFFSYGTINSGWDFPAKNWIPVKFGALERRVSRKWQLVHPKNSLILPSVG